MNKHNKNVKFLVTTGMMAGAGQVAGSALGVNTGVGNMAAMLPATGSIMGAGMLMDTTKKLYKKK